MVFTLPVSTQAPISWNRESLFDAARVGIIYGGIAALFRGAPEGSTRRQELMGKMERHLGGMGIAPDVLAAAAKASSEDAPARPDLWPALRTGITDANERFSSYKLWFCAALHAHEVQTSARRFLQRVREEWHLDALDCLYVSQAILESGALPTLDPRQLEPLDRQRVLALCSIAVHGDQVLHAREVGMFKRTIQLLGFQPGAVGFLKDYADATATTLATTLGSVKLAAGMPHVLRALTADGPPRPAETAILQALVVGGKLPPTVVTAMLMLASYESGIAIEL